ncbi:MAG: nitrite reductase [Chitinophagales bacterium]
MSTNLHLENVKEEAAKNDIIELQQKIADFKNSKMIEDKFKHYRLTRGLYGQRQTGVHMFRTKIPYGKLTTDQLTRIADVSEKYTNGNLHLTTRQNIQYHYIKLDDATNVWTDLAEAGVTAREACGNTVRNLTASAHAGIDPDEPFDVTPYVQETFEYFLRNPICQEMGRKIKPAFSSSEKDSAYTYFHDFGFIPRIQTDEFGEEQRGFKVVIAGGLGAQSIIAPTAYEFLPENQIIPFMEASIRVFDRYGERNKRFKARMKFLVKELGLNGFMNLVEEEWTALKNKTYEINRNAVPKPVFPLQKIPPSSTPNDAIKYESWFKINVFEQKQKGWYAVQLKIHLGDIDAETARQLAALVKEWAADDIRITVNQGFLLRFVRLEALPHLFNELDKLGLAEPGFDTIADITACPGTDTCNLGVTNSTGLATKLEDVIKTEYPELIDERNIHIKISGCMNSCGQHMAANIGFHGSSIKKQALVIPAMQIVLGGGVAPDGNGLIAEKIIKLPTKRIPDALRYLLNDFEDNGQEGEYFNTYFQRLGKRYFYALLKSLAEVETLEKLDYFDWGQNHEYEQAIGVGECAGVSYDVIGAIIGDAIEKVGLAQETLEQKAFADSIYHSYSSFVVGAKALLLAKEIQCNTQTGIIADFDKYYVETGEIFFETSFASSVLQINQNEPSEGFAAYYLQLATDFLLAVRHIRKRQLQETGEDSLVLEHHYLA